jgi:RimJ/RimL family protein N-acetyltransferase
MCAIEIEPVIATARLRLRRPRKADAARIAGLANDFDIARMTSRVPHPYALADAEAWLAHAGAPEPGRQASFAIEHPDEGLVGLVAVYPNADGRSELGYWLGRPYWGQGYATEAAGAAVVWASAAWNRRAIFASHFQDNPASGAVLCKTGFLYTGEVKLTPSVARGEAATSRTMVWLA